MNKNKNSEKIDEQISILRDLEKVLDDKVEIIHTIYDEDGGPKIKKIISSKNPDIEINKYISLKVDVSSVDQDNDELYHALL